MKPRWRFSPTGTTISAVCLYAPSRSGVATSIIVRSRSSAAATEGRSNAGTAIILLIPSLLQTRLSTACRASAGWWLGVRAGATGRGSKPPARSAGSGGEDQDDGRGHGADDAAGGERRPAGKREVLEELFGSNV